jgi:GNAT superfamily N-acetyltransferase
VPPNVTVKAVKSELKDIQPLRSLFLQETNFQIRYNACHERGWTDSYLLTIDDVAIGYGSIKDQDRSVRDTIFEFFVIPPFRKLSTRLFHELLATAGAVCIECQSNDALLSSMLYEFSRNICSDVMLFEDHVSTQHVIPGAVFRPARDDDKVFDHKVEPVGDYVIEQAGEVVATGSFMLHYNRPFADLYMEVREDCRRRGLGSFLLQELKKECYVAGRVPAALCDIRNTASRATLISAGLRTCGFMLTGTISTAG